MRGDAIAVTLWARLSGIVEELDQIAAEAGKVHIQDIGYQPAASLRNRITFGIRPMLRDSMTVLMPCMHREAQREGNGVVITDKDRRDAAEASDRA